jgi:hypothetical protein
MTQKLCNDRKGYDKIFHLALSFGLGCVLAGVFSFVPFSPWLAALCVFGLTLVADFIGALVSTPIAYFANYFTE